MAKAQLKWTITDDVQAFIVLLMAGGIIGSVVADYYGEERPLEKGISLTLFVLLLFLVFKIKAVYSPFTKTTGLMAALVVTLLFIFSAWFLHKIFKQKPSTKEGGA